MEYLEWVRRLDRGVDFDLTWSGMPEFPLEPLGLGPGELLPDEPPEWGSPLLRSAIAEAYRIPERNVLPVNGSTFGIFLACAALLERGDRVLVEHPAYEPLRRIPLFFGASVVRVERRFGEGYGLDRARFLEAAGDGLRLAVLTDPHNPSGVRLAIEDREWLAETAEERGFDVLLDEVYLGFSDDPGLNALRHGDRMISIASLTKSHGFPRLRCGWILAREEIIERAAPLYDYTIGNMSGPGVALGLAAFESREQYGALARARAEENRAVVASWIARNESLRWVPPDAGIVAFPELASGSDATPFTEFAEREFGVRVVPGRFFEVDRAFRIGFGVERDYLEEALARLDGALEKWGGAS